jgi:hypothetical protein
MNLQKSMDTQSLFRELLGLIGSTRPEYVAALGGGYSRQEIESSMEISPIPESLISIYLCVSCDRSKADCFDDFIPAYYLMELDRINSYINMFQEIRADLISEMGEKEGREIMRWEPDMIPFLDDGAGSTIHVRTLPGDESVWVRPKVGNLEKLNTNLDRFILTTIECYRQGAYYQELDDDVYIWDTDWELAEEIVQKIDPEIEDYSPP